LVCPPKVRNRFLDKSTLEAIEGLAWPAALMEDIENGADGSALDFAS